MVVLVAAEVLSSPLVAAEVAPSPFVAAEVAAEVDNHPSV